MDMVACKPVIESTDSGQNKAVVGIKSVDWGRGPHSNGRLGTRGPQNRGSPKYLDTVRPARDDETTCNTAATSCSLFAVSVSNDRRVGDATHETVYSKVVHPSLSVHDSTIVTPIIGTTTVVSGARMLMYWAGSSRTASPRERRPKRGRG